MAKKEKTEDQYRKMYLRLCIENTIPQTFGHIKDSERKFIAQNYCVRTWNEHKDKIIPELKQYLDKKVEDPRQKKLDTFLIKEKTLSPEEEKLLFEEIERDYQMMTDQEKKEREKEILIDMALEGKFDEEE